MGRVGKGMGGHTPVGCSSPVKRPTKNWRAAPLALSPPLGKEGRDETKGVKAWEKRETDGTEQAVTLHRPTGHNQQGPVWRQLLWRPRRGDAGVRRRGSAIFSFSYFLISFFTKIYFCFRNLQEYTRPPRCWAVGTWSPRCRAARAFLQKVSQKICARTPGGSVARQRCGCIWPPGCGATTSHSLLKGLPPHLVQKFQEKILDSS